jgi:hypothetical protein
VQFLFGEVAWGQSPPDKTTEIKVAVTSQTRCEDGDKSRQKTSSDTLAWGGYPDGTVGAHLRSWDAGTATAGFWLIGTPTGHNAVLTGYMGGVGPSLSYRLTARLSRGKFVSGSMEASGESRGSRCTIYRRIRRK